MFPIDLLREIAHWESRTTETEKAALELAMCIDMVGKLAKLWGWGDDEERQAMAQSLFSELSYDLDTRRITHFKLKPWADRFLTIRATMHERDNNDGESDSNGDTYRHIYKGRSDAEKPDQAADVKGLGTHPARRPYGAPPYAMLLANLFLSRKLPKTGDACFGAYDSILPIQHTGQIHCSGGQYKLELSLGMTSVA